MSLPAIRAARSRWPEAHIAVLARPWVADLYARESAIDRVIPWTPPAGFQAFSAKRQAAAALGTEGFDCAVLLQNAFEAAAVVRMAGIPRRIGYARDGRGWLLTDAIPVPEPGDIPRHERFYYLELLRRAGIIHEFPPCEWIRLEGADAARSAGLERFRRLGIERPAIGVSPGAAYGGAKRWPAGRFAEASAELARRHGAEVVLFGSASERPLCETIPGQNLAGQTSLGEFIELAAACRLFLTNDSGAMHVASALDVPTIAVFGSTDHTTTGPAGPRARIIREQVHCSPCLLRECPIDHRCMTGVSAQRVAAAGSELWEESPVPWTHEARS